MWATQTVGFLVVQRIIEGRDTKLIFFPKPNLSKLKGAPIHII
jgi:hypothetical protein